MYFADEVATSIRSRKLKAEKVPKREIDLGKSLIDKMSAEEFEPESTTTNTASAFLP